MGRRKPRRAKPARPSPIKSRPVQAKPAGLSDADRLLVVRYAVLVGLISTLLIAPGLWLSSEYFGPISVFGAPTALPLSLDLVTYGLLLGLLILALRPREADGFIRLWLVLALLRCCWDRILWQPYLLQYACMLLVISWYSAALWRSTAGDQSSGRSDLAAGQLSALRLIVCGVYFWSGFSKFHYGFLSNGAEWLLGGLLPEDVVSRLNYVAWMMPVAETLFAVGLLTNRFRQVCVIGLLGMHLSILWMIGPLGNNANHVVWPWNLVMMACLPTLFWRTPFDYPRGVIRWDSPLANKLTLLLFAVMPAFSYVGLWPTYLSFRLYAVREARAYVEMPLEQADQLPTETQQLLLIPPDNASKRMLPILEFATAEINAIVPTELAVYRHVAKKFSAKHAVGDEMVLAIRHELSTWTNERRWEHFRCDDL